jgi:hypothetical protein
MRIRRDGIMLTKQLAIALPSTGTINLPDS